MRYKLYKTNLTKRIMPVLLSVTVLGSLSACKAQGESFKEENVSQITSELLSPLIVMEQAGFKIETKEVSDDYIIYKLLNNNLDYFLNIKGPNADGSNKFVNYFPYSFEQVCTSLEFAKQNNEVNITWKDIRETLKQNATIDDKIKKIIQAGIDNLEHQKFNINLGTLNYNLKRLKVEYTDKTDEEQYVNIMAKFECDKNTLYVNPTAMQYPLFNRIVCHEVLGHASNIAYDSKNGGTLCTTNIGTAIVVNNKLIGNVTLGKAFEEALAEYISYVATNQKINYDETNYVTPLYFLLAMCKVANITIEEYNDKGVEYLIDKLVNNNLAQLVPNIEAIDINFLCKSQGMKGTLDCQQTFYNILSEYISVYGENHSKEEIKKEAIDIIDIYKKCIEPYHYEDYDFILDYTTNDNIDAISIDGLKDLIYHYIDVNKVKIKK